MEESTWLRDAHEQRYAASAESRRNRGAREIAPAPGTRPDDPGALGLAGAQYPVRVVGLRLPRGCGNRLRPNPPKRLEPTLLRCPVAPRAATFSRTAGRFRFDRRSAADPQCRPTLAGRDLEAQTAP